MTPFRACVALAAAHLALLALPCAGARAASSDPGTLTSSVLLSEDSRDAGLAAVAIPGLVVYAVLGGAVLASYVSLFVLPRADPDAEGAVDGAGAAGRRARRAQRRRMQTTDERAQHRVQKNYHVAALVFVGLRVVSHAAMLCAPAAADRYLLLVRRLAIVVDFSMYSLVLYWWVVCYSRSFRIGARHAIKRTLVWCNAAAYAATVLLLVCWWAVYRAPQASWTGNVLYEGSVWCVVALSGAVAAAASIFAVTLYFRQRHEVWFLRGHRNDLGLIIAFSTVFLLCCLLRAAVFLVRPLFHTVFADWLFYLLGYYVPEATSTALQLVVVHHTPVVEATVADTTLIRTLYTSTRASLLPGSGNSAAAATAADDNDDDDDTTDAAASAVVYVAPGLDAAAGDAHAPRGASSLCASINASAQHHEALSTPGAGAVTADERTLTATSRRNYELYSRNSFAGESSLLGAASAAATPRQYPGSLQMPGHWPHADTRADAAASFFSIDAPAVPVQPLRMSGASAASSFRVPLTPKQ